MTPEAFREARRQAGLTQAQLAAALRVGISTIYRWEHGRTRIPYAVACAMHRLRAPRPQDDRRDRGGGGGMSCLPRVPYHVDLTMPAARYGTQAWTVTVHPATPTRWEPCEEHGSCPTDYEVGYERPALLALELDGYDEHGRGPDGRDVLDAAARCLAEHGWQLHPRAEEPPWTDSDYGYHAVVTKDARRET